MPNDDYRIIKKCKGTSSKSGAEIRIATSDLMITTIIPTGIIPRPMATRMRGDLGSAMNRESTGITARAP
jgi:hypothetical protein